MSMTTANKIKKSALHLFVEKGYDGTSLTDIGDEVGIKKQSIYAHYKNKDDLFLQVMEKVINEEISFLGDYFGKQKDKTINNILYYFILQLKERYQSVGERNIKFLLKMMFIPPKHLEERVISSAFNYYDSLQTYIKEAFENYEDALEVNAEEGTISFMNFIDGLLVELIYVNVDEFEKRFSISWKIYWRGIEKQM
ncbi:TetR/AcrR family transcriptional regulator [Alteribacillus sp. YIM 98480]|uniref:TetR/AcrR family transcriptional regulator n=1 Tax=Alteribacillus sp. YIM 98480 TaxID=2606599 RepID=UPI00131B37CB|nr:TetR/AcrR family transcriptional regulator [Alteribacillus sp. YIM 98480]